MHIDRLTPDLAELCEEQFAQIGYAKPEDYFRNCCRRQEEGEILLFVAHEPGQYVGHTHLKWRPRYPGYRERGIPEIRDLNVLPRFRRQGVATDLIRACEAAAAERADEVGIAVGLHHGYNNAQRLYSNLGYKLDGRGVHYKDEPIVMGESYPFDDDLLIYFVKQLR